MWHLQVIKDSLTETCFVSVRSNEYVKIKYQTMKRLYYIFFLIFPLSLYKIHFGKLSIPFPE